MPLLSALALAGIVLCAIHALKTGRERWIYFIILAPGVGCLIYFFAEMLPDLRESRQVASAKSSLVNKVDPTRNVRRLEKAAAFTGSFNNTRALADEYVGKQMYGQAIQLYEKCLTGMHKEHPGVLLDLGRCLFFAGEHEKARDCLKRLAKADPGYKSGEAHLLYTRSLELMGHEKEALNEYETLIKHFTGEEARFRYANFLLKQGETDQACQVLETILFEADVAPKYYRREQKHWLRLAKKTLAEARAPVSQRAG